MENYYQILELPTSATQDEIKKQYRLLLLSTHPDKQVAAAVPSSSNRVISQLQALYQTLSDPVLKERYDLELAEHFKKLGISNEGMDEYDLDDFNYEDNVFKRDCPRCTVENGFIIKEQDLEEVGTNDDGMGEIIIQCNHCSLWLKIVYYDQGE